MKAETARAAVEGGQGGEARAVAGLEHITHEVRLGDCLDPVSGLASLPDKSCAHVICDPPYEAEAHTLQRRLKRKAGAVLETVPVDFAALTPEVRAGVALEAVRVARRWVLVFCQAEAVQAWREALEAAGGVYKRPAIWVKGDPQPQITGDRPGMGYETIVCAHAPGRSRWNAGGKVGVYYANKTPGWQKGEGVKNAHPTQKPLDLMEALVSDFTDPGELVCDPFAGSCTTGVACKRLGRRFVGWERDPKYHAIAAKRLEAAREQYALRFDAGPEPKQQDLLGRSPLAREG